MHIRLYYTSPTTWKTEKSITNSVEDNKKMFDLNNVKCIQHFLLAYLLCSQQSASLWASAWKFLQLSRPHWKPWLHSLSVSQSPCWAPQGLAAVQKAQSVAVPFPVFAPLRKIFVQGFRYHFYYSPLSWLFWFIFFTWAALHADKTYEWSRFTSNFLQEDLWWI